jgi:hypothetical protein
VKRDGPLADKLWLVVEQRRQHPAQKRWSRVRVPQEFYFSKFLIRILLEPWRRGAVDIASALGTRIPRFESRQSIRFFREHSSAVVYKMTQYALFVC